MNGPKHDVVVGGELKQPYAKQRTAAEIERPQAFFCRRVGDERKLLRFAKTSQIVDRHFQRLRGSDDLHRTVGRLLEVRAEHLMARDDRLDRPEQRVTFQRSAKSRHVGNVVFRAAVPAAIPEPQPQLCRRERKPGWTVRIADERMHGVDAGASRKHRSDFILPGLELLEQRDADGTVRRTDSEAIGVERDTSALLLQLRQQFMNSHR